MKSAVSQVKQLIIHILLNLPGGQCKLVQQFWPPGLQKALGFRKCQKCSPTHHQQRALNITDKLQNFLFGKTRLYVTKSFLGEGGL